MPKIIYDGNCPFCKNYVSKLRLEHEIGKINLIDARQYPETAAELLEQGYDVDTGMVFILDGNIYHAEQALQRLALLSTGSDLFNKFNRFIFRSRALSLLFYPVMRACRNLTITVLGLSAINSTKNEHYYFFKLLSLVFASFGVLHVFAYAFQYNKPSWITCVGIGFFALTLLKNPGSRRLFIGLIVISTVSTITQLPTNSNHSIIYGFFLFATLILGLYHGLRGHAWDIFIQQTALAGRALLIIMYFFGVFHKINTDFLNPEVSCAVTLWREMPYFLSWLNYPIIDYLAIYGTLVGETAIAMCLLVPKWRHIGIISGIAFHALLGLSGYAMYPPFSTLCIALHCCFLSPEAAKRILQATERHTLYNWLKTYVGSLLLITLVVMLVFTAWLRSYVAFGLLWLVIISPFIFFVARYGKSRSQPYLSAGLLSNLIVSFITVLFFANGVAPYVGLKTTQTINMFANLRLEAGISNHLILSDKPGPWSYLEDVVTIQDSGGIKELEYAKGQNLGIVYYQLLHHLQLNPNREVNFFREGKLYKQQSAHTLKDDISRTLHPKWVRKVFHFNTVDFTKPKPCAVDR